MGHNIEKDEAYMWATMVEYIEKEAEAVTSVAGDFLKCKGQTLVDYLHFIRAPGNKGDELAIHILACMTNLKVVVVTKTGFWSTVMDCDPLSADVVLVYLGKSTFRDTDSPIVYDHDSLHSYHSSEVLAIVGNEECIPCWFLLVTTCRVYQPLFAKIANNILPREL